MSIELDLPPEHLDERMVGGVASLILGVPAPVLHIDDAHSTEDKFKVAATKGSEVVKRNNVSKALISYSEREYYFLSKKSSPVYTVSILWKLEETFWTNCMLKNSFQFCYWLYSMIPFCTDIHYNNHHQTQLILPNQMFTFREIKVWFPIKTFAYRKINNRHVGSIIAVISNVCKYS